MPLDTKTKLISIQTLNEVIFDPHTKPSQFHWIKLNPIPHTKIKSTSTTHTIVKSISMSTLTPCHFRAALFCVLRTRVHVHVIQQQYVSHKYEYQLLLFLTSILQQNHENICCVHIYAMFFILLHGIYLTIIRTRYDTGGQTSLRSIPPLRIISWCHMYIGRKSCQYTSVLPTANTGSVWESIAL